MRPGFEPGSGGTPLIAVFGFICHLESESLRACSHHAAARIYDHPGYPEGSPPWGRITRVEPFFRCTEGLQPREPPRSVSGGVKQEAEPFKSAHQETPWTHKEPGSVPSTGSSCSGFGREKCRPTESMPETSGCCKFPAGLVFDRELGFQRRTTQCPGPAAPRPLEVLNEKARQWPDLARARCVSPAVGDEPEGAEG